MHRPTLSLWLIGALLLLLPMCWGDQDDFQNYDDEVTPTPDYDYTATFDYIFYSNTSPEIDYRLYETIEREEEEKDKDTGDKRNKASGIGCRLTPMLLLGLAAQHIHHVL